jgi:choline dehydrogenase
LDRTDLPRYADYVVVGAGPAGCAAASELARSGSASVLVLEAGPDYGPYDPDVWPADLLAAGDLAESHPWEYDSGPTYPDRVVPFERACVIGGCSSHNGCAAIWGHRADYDGWAAMGNPGWSTDELIPLFHYANEAMRVSIPGPAQITPFHQYMLESAAAAGIPMVADLNDLDEPVGMAPSPANIWQGVRWNGAFAFLDPIRGQANLQIAGDSLVDSIEIKNGRAQSVRVVRDGTAHTIQAGTIVVTSGAYNSPTLLMRSGIGPADHLVSMGIGLNVDLPGVGRNLHDHPAVYVTYAGSDTLKQQLSDWSAVNWMPEEQTIAKLRSRHCTEAFDLHIYPVSEAYAGGDGPWSVTIPVSCMTPKSRGTLLLKSREPGAAPIIDHNYLGDPESHDRNVLVDGVRIARDLTRHASQTGILGPELEPGPAMSAEAELASWVDANVRHYFHPAGSCKMGPASDSTSVVDSKGAVHGVPGLYIADCSIMPQVPRANTNIPAVVVGMRIGRWLAESWTHQ